jgi:hypothetical protein
VLDQSATDQGLTFVLLAAMLPLESIASYAVGEQQLPTLHYIPDLITQAEEQRLLQEVHASKAKWVQVCGLSSVVDTARNIYAGILLLFKHFTAVQRQHSVAARAHCTV